MSYERERERMLTEQISARGLRDPNVLDAMRSVPRHLFVRSTETKRAYEDTPLPIGRNQTISQPYMVALMTEALGITGGEKIMEVGTGSGYQAAVLAWMGARVISVECIPELAARARTVLGSLGMLDRVDVVESDGTLGWSAAAPYDGIVVTAGAPEIPRPLLEQLAPGGRLVLPMGERELQTLVRIRRAPEGLVEEYLGDCRFVQLCGRYGWDEPEPEG